MSKVEQLAALRAAGFDVPRTLAVAGRDELAAAARKLPVPFISKHNQGGKGLGVRLFASHDEFDAYLAGPDYEPPVDGITLLQEYLVGGAAADHQGRDRRRRVHLRDHRGHRARRLPAVPGRRLRGAAAAAAGRGRRRAEPVRAARRASSTRSSAGTWTSPRAHGHRHRRLRVHRDRRRPAGHLRHQHHDQLQRRDRGGRAAPGAAGRGRLPRAAAGAASAAVAAAREQEAAGDAVRVLDADLRRLAAQRHGRGHAGVLALHPRPGGRRASSSASTCP